MQSSVQKMLSVIHCEHQQVKEAAAMNSIEKRNGKMLQALLKLVQNAAVRGAGRAGYKGAFEAKVPDREEERI